MKPNTPPIVLCIMGSYHLKTEQFLPIDKNEAWAFFSSPYNLQKITPESMGFEIISEPLGSIYAGQIIKYRVKPVLGIPLFWMTEITHVKEGDYFIDEQRFGPYALWHHQHHFKEVDGGIEMTDIINYKLPLGLLGNFAHWLFVRKQLEGIFSYRREFLNRHFGGRKEALAG